MNQEKYIFKGQLVEARQRANRLEMEIKAQVITMRQYLNIFEPDVAMLPKDEIQFGAERLIKMIVELRDLKKRIDEISAVVE